MKIFLFKRRWLAIIPVLFMIFAVFYMVNYPPVVGASATTRELPIYCVQREDKAVSISFDAAWGDVRVRHYYLDKNGIKRMIRPFYAVFSMNINSGLGNDCAIISRSVSYLSVNKKAQFPFQIRRRMLFPGCTSKTLRTVPMTELYHFL